MDNSSENKQRQTDFLNKIYNYMILNDSERESFYLFLTDLLDKYEEYSQKVISEDNYLQFHNLSILVKTRSEVYRKMNKTDNTPQFIAGVILLDLRDIHFMRVFTAHLQVDLDKKDREDYFYHLAYRATGYDYFQRFIKSLKTDDFAIILDFFINRNLEKALNPPNKFQYCYDTYYSYCVTAISGDPPPVLTFEKPKTIMKVSELNEQKTLSTQDNFIFNFENITDSFYLLKKIISSSSSATLAHDDTIKSKLSDTFISEEQFYNAIQRLDFKSMLDGDYKKLFKMSLSYSDDRSLSYLLSMETAKVKIFNFLEAILYEQELKKEELNMSSKFELFVDYLGIEMFYSHSSSFNYPVCSAFENICYYKHYEFIDILLKKGLDVSKVPNINNFLNYSSWQSPLNAIPIFKSVKDYVINQSDVLYNFCYAILYDEKNTNSDLLNFLKSLDVNIFEVKDKDQKLLVHSMFKRLNKTFLLPVLDYMFEYKSESIEWKYTNDVIGNNFTHLCIYLSGFIGVAAYLVKNRDMLELFFEVDLNDRRPIDYVLQCEPESLSILVNLLNSIIPAHDSLYVHVKPILDNHKDLLIDDEGFRAVINNYIDPCMQRLLIELDKNYPVVKDYIMYDVYTDEKINEFEKYIKEMLDEDNNVFNWIPKLRERSGSRKLSFTIKIKKNLSQLRETFPNFKEFIDHVDNNIHLNDLGSGYFWIPPSLLVSSPGIGKTFFLHCLAKAVGVTYDMISMESVTAGFVLVGSNQQWRGGQPGAIFHKVFNSDYANNILILDEIDKTPNSNYPVDTVLLPLLETHTAKNFKDEYANIPLDISKMVWVATANDIDAISAPIKSRFQVFNIPSPTFEERLILAQAIYSTLLKDNVWGAKFEKILDQSVLMELARDKNSSRDLRKTILDACGRAAKRKDNKLTLNDLNIIKTNKEILPWDKKYD